MGAAENEDANMDFLNPSHVKTLMLVKIRAFGQMIKETRDRTAELYRVRKQSREADEALHGLEEDEVAAPEDQPMVDEAAEESKQQIAEESKEAVIAPTVASASPEAAPTTEEQKQEEQKQEEGKQGGEESSQAQTRVEQTEHPQIKVSVEVDLAEPIADQVVAEGAQPEAEAAAAQTVAEAVQSAERSDVEMTDENREMLSGLLGSEEEKSEEPSSADALKPAMRKRRSSARSRRLSSVHAENADKELIDGMDLNDLIQKHNGADVDLLFYFKGKLMPQNTCFYEIYQLAQKDRKK